MFEEHSSLILQILRERELLTAEQLAEVEEEHSRTGKSVADIVTNQGLVSRERMLQLVADYLGTDFIQLDDLQIPQELILTVPSSSARIHGIVPIATFGNQLKIAIRDPFNSYAAQEIGFILNKDIETFVADPEKIDKFIEEHYNEESIGDILTNLEKDFSNTLVEQGKGSGPGGGVQANIDIMEEANSQPIIKFVNLVLYQAIKDRASDVHFEPFENEFKIRYRVDGALLEMSPPPKQMAAAVTSRIKVMSNLNIAERRLPQDGRIMLNIGGRPVDLRVSTLPTQHGESVVLRVLDRSVVSLDLENLGMTKRLLQDIFEIIEKPNGIFIVTGPTGSGKTTTLYSCLRRVNSIDVKILTAEDPVEYDIEGIMQVPINGSIGNSFAKVLRAFLRQDPDIIMVGETRDLETAQIAIQASLTGHLVFTTLHTNDAPGAVTRLVDMSVEPFLISSSVIAILAQRLVRTICKGCRTPYEPTEEALASINMTPSEVSGKSFFYGRGCSECDGTGYRGRKGIYEILHISDPIRELINRRAPSMVIRQKALELGMVGIRDDGLRSIFDGETTIEEVVKYT
jgi:type IV pilus assembly protein PilB